MTLHQSLDELRTVLEIDILDDNGNLFSRQETDIPMIRVGSQNGVEIVLGENSLNPIHMVFHTMSTDFVCVDVPFDFPPTYYSTQDKTEKKVLKTPKVWKLKKGDIISVLGYHFHIIDISQQSVETLRSKLQQKIDRDVQMGLRHLGITGNESTLDKCERYASQLVRKVSVFSNGIASELAQLKSACRSIVMKANTILNSTNISSEFLFRTVVAQNLYLKSLHEILEYQGIKVPKLPEILITNRDEYIQVLRDIVSDLEKSARQPGAEDVISDIEAQKRRQRIRIVDDPPDEAS